MSNQITDLYSDNVDLENLSVDELVQRLEAMEKNNEQVKRENQLFESFILRRQKEDRKTEEDMAQKYKQAKQKYGDKMQLSAERKYDIASGELLTLKHNIDEGRTKSETLLERLKAILEGTDISIAEIRKEAFDFGRFLSSAENGRIGKYDAEKLSKYIFDKALQKEAQIEKLTQKNVTLKVAILKAEAQIKQKEEMGDDLKFIDFHQMQIANKKHVKEIEERNRKLIKLKLSSGSTTQMLTKLKKNLSEAEYRAAQFKKDKQAKLASLAKKQADIEKTDKATFEISEKQRELKQLVQNKKDMPEPLNFVKQRNDCVKEARENQDWKRKIEISEFEAKKARAYRRKYEQNQQLQQAEFGNQYQ